jgi:hypothetical protein
MDGIQLFAQILLTIVGREQDNHLAQIMHLSASQIHRHDIPAAARALVLGRQLLDVPHSQSRSHFRRNAIDNHSHLGLNDFNSQEIREKHVRLHLQRDNRQANPQGRRVRR